MKILTDFKTPVPLKSFDLACLAANLSIYRLFTKAPLGVVTADGGSGVSGTLGSGIFAIFFVGLLALIFSRFGSARRKSLDRTFIGGFLCRILFFAVLLYLGLSFITATGEFSALAKAVAFPKSPLWFVAAFFIAAAFLGAFCSFPALLQIHGILVPICGFGLVLLCLLTAPTGSIFNLFPILGSGVAETVKTGFKGCLFYADILLLFLIVPEEENRREYYKAIFCGTLAAAAVNVLFVLFYSLAVSFPEVIGEHIPIYLLLKEVRLGRFIQRIDAVIQLLSALSGFLYLAFVLSLSASVLRRLLDIPQKSGGEDFEKI